MKLHVTIKKIFYKSAIYSFIFRKKILKSVKKSSPVMLVKPFITNTSEEFIKCRLENLQ